MATHKYSASRPHDEAMVEMLKSGTRLAEIYLATALEEASLPGGQIALIAAQRHIAEAQGGVQAREKADTPHQA
jgi:DNA-binding phage protein